LIPTTRTARNLGMRFWSNQRRRPHGNTI
jgi:hypothetical protein